MDLHQESEEAKSATTDFKTENERNIELLDVKYNQDDVGYIYTQCIKNIVMTTIFLHHYP